jgi:hypothetical protein
VILNFLSQPDGLIITTNQLQWHTLVSSGYCLAFVCLAWDYELTQSLDATPPCTVATVKNLNEEKASEYLKYRFQYVKSVPTVPPPGILTEPLPASGNLYGDPSAIGLSRCATRQQ